MTVQPNLRIKDQQTFRHDLFKAEVASMKRNMSWKKGIVSIQTIEHSHWYHTCNSQGRPQRYTNTVGGHFHEIEWQINAKGDLVAKCSKPMTHKYKMAAGRHKKILAPVSWMDEENDREVNDDHTHKMIYIHSEILSQATIKQATQGAMALAIEEQKRAQTAKDVGLEGAE